MFVAGRVFFWGGWQQQGSVAGMCLLRTPRLFHILGISGSSALLSAADRWCPRHLNSWCQTPSNTQGG